MKQQAAAGFAMVAMVLVIACGSEDDDGRGMGESCGGNNDCDSRFCFMDPVKGSPFCTTTCTPGSCPAGFSCQDRGGTLVCVAGGSVAFEDFASELAKALCETYGGCCALSGAQPDPSCPNRFAATIEETMAERMGLGARYDGAAASECIAGTRSAAGTCAYLDEPVACSHVLKGPLQPGEPCTMDEECEPPQGGYAQCFEDRCIHLQPVGPGEKCEQLVADNLAAICDEDGWCTEGQICMPLHGEGETCGSGSAYCRDHLYCEEGAATCFPKREAGQPCTSFTECLGDCVSETNLCEIPLLWEVCLLYSNEAFCDKCGSCYAQGNFTNAACDLFYTAGSFDAAACLEQADTSGQPQLSPAHLSSVSCAQIGDTCGHVGDPCLDCAADWCCPQLLPCAEDHSGCVHHLSCAVSCEGDQACLAGCESGPLLAALSSCTATRCADLCPPLQ